MIGTKGSMLDIFLVAILLFVFLIALLFGVFILDSVYADPTVNATMPATATQHLVDSKNILLSFDGLIVVLLFGASVASIISAFMVRTHPAFFIIAMLFQLIMVGISTVFSNMYYYIASIPVLAPIANQFPIAATVMNMLPVILLVISSLIAIVMYGKASGGQQYAY